MNQKVGKLHRQNSLQQVRNAVYSSLVLPWRRESPTSSRFSEEGGSSFLRPWCPNAKCVTEGYDQHCVRFLSIWIVSTGTWSWPEAWCLNHSHIELSVIVFPFFRKTRLLSVLIHIFIISHCYTQFNSNKQGKRNLSSHCTVWCCHNMVLYSLAKDTIMFVYGHNCWSADLENTPSNAAQHKSVKITQGKQRRSCYTFCAPGDGFASQFFRHLRSIKNSTRRTEQICWIPASKLNPTRWECMEYRHTEAFRYFRWQCQPFSSHKSRSSVQRFRITQSHWLPQTHPKADVRSGSHKYTSPPTHQKAHDACYESGKYSSWSEASCSS